MPTSLDDGDYPLLLPRLLPRTAHRRGGGALVMVMLIVCILSVVASSMLLTTVARYHTTYQSASWQEAIVGAEAGIDLGMSELRKRVEQGPVYAFLGSAAATKASQSVYWSSTNPATGVAYPNSGEALLSFSDTKGVQPDTLAPPPSGFTPEGNATLQGRVFVDVPGSSTTPASNFAVTSSTSNNSFISQFDNPALRDADGVDRSRWFYRIRALGVAGLSGPARPNIEKLDNHLRRFSFFSDWRTGNAVSTPQVARMVEIVAQPETNFRNALMADKQINLSNQDVLIDSYDSSKGAYDASTNHGNMGNLATNGKLINANNATVDGNAMTNNGTVNDGDNVTGQQSGNFYQELTPFSAGLLNPSWTSVKDDGTLTGNASYTASIDSTSPKLVRVDGINLPTGGNVINITAPAGTAANTPTYIKIYVQGDLTTTGTSYINLDPSVNAIIYVSGNVNLQGNGIINNSFLARQLVINGLQPPANTDGTYPSRTLRVATSQDFEGIVYAPNHDLTLALTAAGVTGQTGSVTGNAAQILALQQNILSDQQNITALTADYTYNMALYNAAPGNSGHVYYEKAQQDQTYITNLNTAIAGFQAQLQVLVGINPSSSADDHTRGYNGIYGGFIGKTITVSNKTHLHYDETLRTAGPVNHYEIVSWFEDNVSHGAVGGSTAFWWGTPQ